jgi:hypothetical protein
MKNRGNPQKCSKSYRDQLISPYQRTNVYWPVHPSKTYYKANCQQYIHHISYHQVQIAGL